MHNDPSIAFTSFSILNRCDCCITVGIFGLLLLRVTQVCIVYHAALAFCFSQEKGQGLEGSWRGTRREEDEDEDEERGGGGRGEEALL